jgi:hypothetical protein
MVVMVGTGTPWTVSPMLVMVMVVLVVMPGSWVSAVTVVMAVWARSWGTG